MWTFTKQHCRTKLVQALIFQCIKGAPNLDKDLTSQCIRVRKDMV